MNEPLQAQEPPASAVQHDKIELTVHLRKIPLFSELTETEMKTVQESLRFRFFEKRAVVFQQGALHGGLVFLLSGQLQLLRLTEDGRAISMGMIPHGGFFGEVNMLNEEPYTASGIALDRVLVAILPQLHALRLFSHCPSVANHLLRHLARQVQRDTEFKAMLSISNTPRRIVNFIILQIQRNPTPGQPQTLDNLPTHQDIANMINTSRETVTRVLNELTQKGIIQRKNHQLIILDPSALSKIATDTDKT